jgi:hypothetical protein
MQSLGLIHGPGSELNVQYHGVQIIWTTHHSTIPLYSCLELNVQIHHWSANNMDNASQYHSTLFLFGVVASSAWNDLGRIITSDEILFCGGWDQKGNGAKGHEENPRDHACQHAIVLFHFRQ